MMSTSPGGAAAPAAVEDGEIGGLRQSIDKFRGTDTVYGVLSLQHFRLAGIVLFIPWRVVAEHLARRVLVAAATAADFFLLIQPPPRLAVLGPSRAAAAELWGRPALPAVRLRRVGGLRRPLAPTFPAGGDRVVYPLAGGRRTSGAASSGCGGDRRRFLFADSAAISFYPHLTLRARTRARGERRRFLFLLFA